MERERGISRERAVPNPNSNSNLNLKSNPNPDPDSNPNNTSTIFVSNLPVILDVFGFRGIFSRIGRVEEVSIPEKQEGKLRYGFVKFENQGDARRSIRLLNNRSVRGFRIWVQFARRDFSRARQGFPNKARHQTKSMPFPSVNIQNRGVDADLMESLKKNLAGEVNKLVQLRKALDSILGKFEGLVDSKSFRCIIGVLTEVAENLKAANPSSNPDPFQNNSIPSFTDIPIGKRVVEPSSFNEEVVVESPPHLKSSPNEFEVGENQDSEEVDVGFLKDAEAEDMESDKLSPEFVPDSETHYDHFCFSSKSNSKRRKKRRKPRMRPSLNPTKTGVKRKYTCQATLSSQGSEKRFKGTKEILRQWQGEGVSGFEVLNPSIIEAEVVGDVGEPLVPMSSPISSPPSLEEVPQTTISASSDSPEDRLRTSVLERSPDRVFKSNLSFSSTESEKLVARKAICLGNRAGVKVVGCPVGAMKRITRNLKKNRRNLSPISSISGTF